MRAQQKTALQLSGVVVLMVSMSFAAVPFYDWFCRTTGFGGTTAVAVAASDVVLERTVKVRFDASLEAGMPWHFRPQQTEMILKIGEQGLAFFEASNPTKVPVAGTASYNVYPYSAGGFFYKIACFCFEQQVLQPGESVVMPVSFYVDPAMVDDRDAKFVQEITLSYTFHQTELPDDQVAPADQAALVAPVPAALD